MDEEQKRSRFPQEITTFGFVLRELGSRRFYRFSAQDLLGKAPRINKTFLQQVSRLSHSYDVIARMSPTISERVVSTLSDAISRLEEERHGYPGDYFKNNINDRLASALGEDRRIIANEQKAQLVVNLLIDKTGLSTIELIEDLIKYSLQELVTKWGSINK